MGSVYGNATLVIATAMATTENDPLIISREKKWEGADVSLSVDPIGSVQLGFRRRSHLLLTERAGGDYGKISTRAWTWQERLLAPRTVFFTPSAVKFECHCTSLWEDYSPHVEAKSWSSQLEDDPHLKWSRLVEEFTRRDITRSSDRLPALGSVMERIRAATGWTPLFGLWKERLRQTLCWESENNSFLTPGKGRMNPTHNAPTWSWASVNGRITWPVDADNSFEPDFEILEHPSEANNNALKISGLSTICVVFLSTHQTKPWVEVSDVPLRASGQYYFVKLPGDPDNPHIFKQDVPLEPSEVTVPNAKAEHSVRRIPFGSTQQQPDEWISLCFCLYMGFSKGYHYGMLIGNSERVPGAWERLGIVSDFPFEAFEHGKREEIVIV
jgi:hypothetical protein